MSTVATDHPLRLADSVRRLERSMISAARPGALMDKAADALADQAVSILRDRPGSPGIVGLIGPGNNGADVLACLYRLRQRGYQACAACLGDRGVTGEWQDWMRRWLDAGGQTVDTAGLHADHELVSNAGLFVDGLFGIGLNRPLNDSAAAAARLTHRVHCPVLSADVPSGLNCDTGQVIGGSNGVAVRATHTVTFISDKPGLHTGSAADHVGQLSLVTLDAPRVPVDPADGGLVTMEWVSRQLSARAGSTHKGTFGTVAIVGGAASMPGAALLAAQGARAAGAGKVATLSPDGPLFDNSNPQLMAWTLDRSTSISRRLHGVDAAAVGCGLGQSALAGQWLDALIASDLPLVVDADALNLMATPGDGDARRDALAQRSDQQPTIITPHPLEAARLLSTDTGSVQADRIAAARELAARFAATVLLKGSGTVLCTPKGHWLVIDAGNAALATGGTGDVLSGVIAGLLAQGHGATRAAALAAWLHGAGADHWRATHRAGIGMDLADLLTAIVDTVNRLAQNTASQY